MPSWSNKVTGPLSGPAPSGGSGDGEWSCPACGARACVVDSNYSITVVKATGNRLVTAYDSHRRYHRECSCAVEPAWTSTEDDDIITVGPACSCSLATIMRTGCVCGGG